MNLRTAIGSMLAGVATLALVAVADVAPDRLDPAEQMPELRPGVRTIKQADQVGCVFGTLATGATPSDSAKAFLDADCMRIWGVQPADLAPYGPFENGEHLVPIMPEEETSGYRFTGVYFTQRVGGIPVYKANLLVLTRNEPGFPAVLASSTLWQVDQVREQLGRTDLGSLPPAATWTRLPLNQFRANPEVGPAQYVVWAGIDRTKAAQPRLAVNFVAEGGGHWDPQNHQRIEFVVDAETGEILYQESKIYHAVTGQVKGMATQGVGADACNPETSQGMPYVKVQRGSQSTFADASGNFSIAGSSTSTPTSTSLVGRFFSTTNNGAPPLSTTTNTSDNASWNPTFNSANTSATDRAQVNAYLYANRIRDLVLSANASYPTIATQSGFQVNANLASTCNAYYVGNTINFYVAGGGCANTAFNEVIAHEFGHNVVAKGGSGQGAYGEGMSDVHSVLLTDDPRLGVGFFGSCTGSLRNADNSCQFSAAGCSSCGTPIHQCGQLLSGCFWDLRNRLAAAYPTSYRAKLAAYAVNSVLLHGPVTTINNEIVVHVLTLDDNNGNIGDGTPNYQIIADAFGAHGLQAPGLTIPTNLAASDGTSSFSVDLTWNAPSSATSFRIFRAVGSGTPVQVGSSTSRSYSDLSATAGTVYTYTVRTATGSNLGPASAPDTGWRTVPGPSTVTASDGSSTSSVTVTWSTVSGATGYRVLRSLPDGTPTQIGSTLSSGTTSYIDSTVTAGTLHAYRVKAVIPLGESMQSAADNGWRNVPAPTNVSATDGTSSSQITLTWTPVAGATGYKIYRSIGTGTPTVTYFSGGSMNTLHDGSAVAGTVYTYWVRATTNAGDSAASATNTGWRAISPPTNVSATDGTSSSNVTVSWTSTSGATGYKVFRATSVSGALVQVGSTLPSTSNSFADTTGTPAFTYYYAVKAVTAAGDTEASVRNSGWRNLSGPGNVNATDGTSTANVTITWSGVSGATGYRVYRSVGASPPVQVGGNLGASTLSLADSTASAGVILTYTVKAVSALGLGMDSTPTTGWRNINPPSGVAATDGTSASGVTISWNQTSSATGYKVFRAIGTATPTLIGTVTPQSTISYVDTTATPGTVYNYSVRCMTAAGDSALSTANSGWRGIGVPTNVTATDGTSTASVTVTWSAVSGATGYKVFRAIGTGTATQVSGTLSSSATVFADLNATAGVLYRYTVKATSSIGDGASSASNDGWRNVPSPTGVLATDGTISTHVRVTWTAATNTAVTGYRVYRQILGSGSTVSIATVNGRTNVTYNDAAISPGLIGTYSVAAITAAGESARSATNTGFRPVSDEGSAAGIAGDPTVDGTRGTAEAAGDRALGGALALGGQESGEQGMGSAAATEASADAGADGAPVGCSALRERVQRLADRADADGDADRAQRLRDLLPAASDAESPEARPTGATADEGCRACRMHAGDVNLDGKVDFDDVDAFVEAWQARDSDACDLDRDGKADGRDLVRLLEAMQRSAVVR